MDRNGNGEIDNGTELFGNFTPQGAGSQPNGFAALALFDLAANGGNGNGDIDAEDSVYGRLRLWVDANHDGRTQSGELLSLPAAGIRAINLTYHESRRRDRFGNVFRLRARVDSTLPHVSRYAYDVFLLFSPQ